MRPPGSDGDGGSSFPDEEFDRAKSKVRCREKFNFIADVVSEVAPALVFIQIKDRNTTDYYTNEPMTSSTGSGFIVSSDGLIVTNAHVVLNKPRTQFEVQLQDGRKFPGRVESIDVKSDLATVRIDAKNLPVMPLGTSSDTKPGEFVIAMGSPLSLSNTITTGVVSSVTRQGKELGIKNRDVPIYIQTDASITFGNSGGPLVNLDGEAIGVNSMKITPGISFAIPIDYTKEFLRRSAKELREGKRPKEKGFLGLRYLVLSPQTRAGLEIPSAVPHGIIVNRIVVGSPAHRAGIQPGDIIMDINGTPIKTGNDYNRMLEVDAHEDVEFKVGLVRRTGPNSFQKMKAVLRPVFN